MKFSLAFADQSIIVKCSLWIWNENKELGATENWRLVNMSERFTLKKGTCLALKLTQWNYGTSVLQQCLSDLIAILAYIWPR